MTVFNFYLFNRAGQCIYYKEWNRWMTRFFLLDKQLVNLIFFARKKYSGLSPEQEAKQMFGLIIEMKSFVGKMAPDDL